jgi:hypothetical protein
MSRKESCAIARAAAVKRIEQLADDLMAEGQLPRRERFRTHIVLMCVARLLEADQLEPLIEACLSPMIEALSEADNSGTTARSERS